MDLIASALAAHERWRAEYPPFDTHPSLDVPPERMEAALAELGERLRDNYPFFHPRYAGQMLKPPHPAAVAGQLATMLVNPNNHALDGGPATAKMEREVVERLAGMFGYGEHLGHLTTSGTIANLEALFVARELHPGRGVAYSAESHYTHARMCGVLGVTGHTVPVDPRGRIDADALDALLARGEVGTVVATAGTTGLGAVDPVHDVIAVARRHGVRVHVDAAYGGFFALLAGEEGIAPEPWRAIADADSVVVDPHKHGLQPYGCGAILFKDPAVGRFYLHDSPYTYFTSDELHLGEISLECSRAGAAAAGLWLTFEVFPPEALAAVLAAGRRAALRWAERLQASETLALYQPPELDIVAYLPAEPSLSRVDAASARMLARGMEEDVFISTLRVTPEAMARRHPAIQADAEGARILRSVLMKPEHETHVEELHAAVEALV